ncbi:hypothetical protein V2J09_021227 [Rumex salicifolius]
MRPRPHEILGTQERHKGHQHQPCVRRKGRDNHFSHDVDDDAIRPLRQLSYSKNSLRYLFNESSASTSVSTTSDVKTTRPMRNSTPYPRYMQEEAYLMTVGSQACINYSVSTESPSLHGPTIPRLKKIADFYLECRRYTFYKQETTMNQGLPPQVQYEDSLPMEFAILARLQYQAFKPPGKMMSN